MNDSGNCAQRVFGSSCIECFSTKRGEVVDFARAIIRCCCLGLRAREQSRGDDACEQERRKNSPIERFCNDQRSVRREKKPVETEEREHCEQDPNLSTLSRAATEYNEEICECNVRFVQIMTHEKHRCRNDGENNEPRSPRPVPGHH